jgi:hypothetical protein
MQEKSAVQYWDAEWGHRWEEKLSAVNVDLGEFLEGGARVFAARVKPVEEKLLDKTLEFS